MPTARLFASILSIPAIDRTRRNHGLEHATMQILARRLPGVNLAGHSTPNGFRIVGNVPIETIQEAVEEALQRLKAGEHHLAIHPFCGTNFVVSGTLAGLAGAFGMAGGRRMKFGLLDRLAMAVLLAVMSLIIAQPLGLMLQREVTTDGRVGDMHIMEINRSEYGGMILHQIVTRG